MHTLRDNLTELSTMVSNAILQGTQALISHDAELARQVTSNDSRLNKLRFNIDEYSYEMLHARDIDEREVRRVVSIVMISQALEHIGDSAANVAHLALRMSRNGGNGVLREVNNDLDAMAHAAAEMVHDAVKAFVEADARLAEATVRRDWELNEAYERLYALIGHPSAEGQRPLENRLLMLWAAHNLQHIGGYASDICERAIFVATGEMKEFN